MSVEWLFWTPFGMDLLLLVTTYSCCKFGGSQWYLKTMKEHKVSDQSGKAKKSDDGVVNATASNEDVDTVWELAMIAYSAYGCLLPWAAFVAYTDPKHRVSLSWAMTALMLSKLASKSTWNWQDAQARSKIMTILFFNLPTYGGYAVYKTFIN